MKSITRKPVINLCLETCFEAYTSQGLSACANAINTELLSNKIKFPMLEYCAQSLYEFLPENDHIPFCDKIESFKTMGGNVLLGIILQKRLTDHFNGAIEKAAAYIAVTDVWYVCDIIGERVFGYSLLHNPLKTITEFNRLATTENFWVVRSLGAGAHYAIKKGLEKEHVKTIFKLLLSMSNTKNKEIRQGVGWAAKTTAKFHPDIIEHYKNEINDVNDVANWFRKKIEIGLNRNSYAKRN